jgi:DNA invertase Pin-like site-specific DNA recombinase
VTKPEKSATSITTALVYTRVSSEEQAREGVSLDAQLTECRRYAAQSGWMLGPEFQDVLSGKRDDRPAYQALLTEVRQLRAGGQPVVVVVFRLDRLGRRILERVRCREELKALGVPVHSVREGGEVSDLVANILASVAEEESRALGERVAASIQHIRANGWYPPNRAPWGYRLRSSTVDERAHGAPASVLEPDPETMTWVQEAFFRAAAGETLHAVHRWATALPSQARGDRVLTYQALRRILASPVYIGRLPYKGDDVLARPLGRWMPLVDDATWLRVRDQVRAHQRLPRQASQQYLLSGLLRCPKCGARMHGRAREGHAQIYRCSAANLGANVAIRGCATNTLANQVDEAVRAEILPLIETAVSALPELREALERAWAALRTPATLQDELQERHRKQLVRETEQARARLTKAAVLFADGDIDKPGYELLRDKARVDLDAATQALSQLQVIEPRVTLPPLETVLAAAEGWGAAMRDGEIAAQRGVLAILIEQVVPVRTRRGQYEVEVAWTPLAEALRAAVLATNDITTPTAA